MSKKRRTFDIDLPDEDVTETFPAGKVSEPERRGPMAAAINENAKSLKERQRIEAEIRAENDELAHKHVRLQKEGLVVERIAFEKIKMNKITRDRTRAADFELPELVESIKAVGLSNPIQVEENSDGQYELVQGYRRIAAFKELLKETGDQETYGTIPARIMSRGASLELLHRRMVDENLVRKDISFAEMAQLALHYAADPGTSVDDPEKAVKVLFNSASYSKRSYIRNFIKLIEVLGENLKFAHEIPRALGLKVSAALEEIEETARYIRRDLKELGDNRSVESELSVLRKYANLMEGPDGQIAKPKESPKLKPLTGVESKAKVTFQVKRPEGAAKCTAGAGRLEIRLDRDFSTVDRRALEDAVKAFLDQIG